MQHGAELFHLQVAEIGRGGIVRGMRADERGALFAVGSNEEPLVLVLTGGDCLDGASRHECSINLCAQWEVLRPGLDEFLLRLNEKRSRSGEQAWVVVACRLAPFFAESA